ncbi:hypothetical protein F511_11229 [Dorcoceras hygrometricum]|uniref:Uncharacterized protein n=1 Tax=Dorcoceras hygrometricum TaxID=472368 RepID=A0A2Z7DKZ1_9LAMI|nr:hypothetical protein F511_11229 [Dorcoceras hygrometricum]
MELVLARFRRTNYPMFTGAEGGLMAEGWLKHMEELLIRWSILRRRCEESNS